MARFVVTVRQEVDAPDSASAVLVSDAVAQVLAPDAATWQDAGLRAATYPQIEVKED